jgi:nucleoside-diphosphate kinase
VLILKYRTLYEKARDLEIIPEINIEASPQYSRLTGFGGMPGIPAGFSRKGMVHKNRGMAYSIIMERTFVMLKPGVLQRRVAGEVLSRFERKGLKIIALKLLLLDTARVEAHYAEHRGKDFYKKLVDYTCSGPVIALILAGEEAISRVRRLAGPTDIRESLPGTIRGDFAGSTRLNIVHASDSPENAAREIGLFFTPEEIYDWEDGNARWF